MVQETRTSELSQRSWIDHLVHQLFPSPGSELRTAVVRGYIQHRTSPPPPQLQVFGQRFPNQLFYWTACPLGERFEVPVVLVIDMERDRLHGSDPIQLKRPALAPRSGSTLRSTSRAGWRRPRSWPGPSRSPGSLPKP